MNDLSQSLSDCFVVQYADGTQLLLTGDIENIPNLIERAGHLLSTAKVYFQKNGLL